MANLSDILGALIINIGRGRSQADMATIEVAEIYKKHPLLSSFPIPKVTLDEVVVDLKLAIKSGPEIKESITSEIKKEFIDRLNKIMVDTFNKDRTLVDLKKKFPKLQESWRSAPEQIVKIFSDSLPDDGEINTAAAVNSAVKDTMIYLINTLMAKEIEVSMDQARDFLAKGAPQLEKRLYLQIYQNFQDILKERVVVKDRLEVLVTAADLQVIPQEKITTLKITLRESDVSWTQFETEKGQIKEKLIPS